MFKSSHYNIGCRGFLGTPKIHCKFWTTPSPLALTLHPHARPQSSPATSQNLWVQPLPFSESRKRFSYQSRVRRTSLWMGCRPGCFFSDNSMGGLNTTGWSNRPLGFDFGLLFCTCRLICAYLTLWHCHEECQLRSENGIDICLCDCEICCCYAWEGGWSLLESKLNLEILWVEAATMLQLQILCNSLFLSFCISAFAIL